MLKARELVWPRNMKKKKRRKGGNDTMKMAFIEGTQYGQF
jgi:hypothetical protein